MNRFFSEESKFTRIMGRIGNLTLLNVLFVLTSIPIITIGAACTAMYTVCFRLGTDQEEPIIKAFFKSFFSNFKQATIIWLILLVCGASMVLYFFMFLSAQGALYYLAIPAAVFFILVVMFASYAFPLLSQFVNSTQNTLRNAMVLCIGCLPKSILITLLNILPFLFILFIPYIFTRYVGIWIFFYFSVSAYINCRLFNRIFDRYNATNLDVDSVSEE